MILLADTLQRSAPARVGEPQGSNLFPLLVLAIPIARQGHIEAAATYVLARTLGSLNAEALRTREGFGGGTSYPERDVSRIEGMNTEQAIVSDALALFDEYFASYSLRTYGLYLLFSLPLVVPLLILYLVTSALGHAIEVVATHVGYSAPIDPWAF